MSLSPMRMVWAVVALAIAALAMLTLKPELLPWTSNLVLTFPFAQLVALRGWEAIILAVAAVFFLVLGLVRRFIMRRGRISLALSLVLILCAGVHGATIVHRGIFNEPKLSTDYGVSEGGMGDGSITLMQFNTQGGRVPVSDLANAIEENGVDVVTLAETSLSHGEKLVQELAARGLSFQIFHNKRSKYLADWGSTVVLISAGMGKYAEKEAPQSLQEKNVVALAVAPVSGKGPAVLAVHAESPSESGRVMQVWREEISALYGLCKENSNMIIAGDFNSTVDHEVSLGGSPCNDAMIQAGSGGLGTWPSNISPYLGSVIDRVLLPPGYRGSEGKLVEAGSSDHRGIIVRIKVVGS